MLNILVRWLVFVHILAAITFFLAHGTSAAMAFQVRRESDFNRIRALLDLSWSTMIISSYARVGTFRYLPLDLDPRGPSGSCDLQDRAPGRDRALV